LAFFTPSIDTEKEQVAMQLVKNAEYEKDVIEIAAQTGVPIDTVWKEVIAQINNYIGDAKNKAQKKQSEQPAVTRSRRSSKVQELSEDEYTEAAV